MTHALNLVLGGTTINLASGTNYLLDYVPVTASASDETVTESARVWLTGADQDTVQTNIGAIDGFFRDCRLRQKIRGYDTGYVQISMTNESATYRSEIIDGQLSLDENAWRHWSNNGVECVITWTRKSYWENATRTVLNLSSDTSGTGGVTINNGFVVGGPPERGNFASVNTTIAGSLPTPVEFELTNIYDDPSDYFHKEIWVGNFYDQVTAVLPHASAGTVTYTSTGTGWEDAYSYTTLLDLEQFKGRVCEVVAGFDTAPSGTPWVRWQWKLAAQPVWYSEPVQLSNLFEMQSMGVIQLPPWLPGQTSLADLTLTLQGRLSTTWKLYPADIQFFLVENSRFYYPVGYGLAEVSSPYYKLVDDGIDVYVVDDNTEKSAFYNVRGDPILLYPGYNNTIFVWVRNDQGEYQYLRTSKIQAWYRERRLSV